MEEKVDVKGLLASASTPKVSKDLLTLDTYVDLVRKEPTIAGNAALKLYKSIERHGIERTPEPFALKKDAFVERWKFFNMFYGVNDNINSFMNLVKSAAMGSELSKRLWLLLGPVGAGKSDFVTVVKRNLCDYSYTDQGAYYRINYNLSPEEITRYGLVKGHCPINEDPLRAVPPETRAKLLEGTGLNVKGHLCPHCQMVLERHFEGDITKFRAERFVLNVHNRTGMGKFVPDDPKSQTPAALKGDMNVKTIGQHGLTDPASFNYGGEVNYGNRGMLELCEFFKTQKDLRNDMLFLTEEQCLKIDNLPMIHIDEVLLAHTNESEWRKFKDDPTEEAMKDRIVALNWSYCMEYSQEEKIYQKLIKNNVLNGNEVHIAPGTLRTAAQFAILTRLRTHKYKAEISLSDKMKFYNGEKVHGLGDADYHGFKKEVPQTREGLEGIGPRKILDILNQCISDKLQEDNRSDKEKASEKHVGCVSGLTFISKARKYLATAPELDREQAAKYDKIIQSELLPLFVEYGEKTLKSAAVKDQNEAMDELFDRYMSQISLLSERETQEDEFGQEIKADEQLIRSVEQAAGIGLEQAESFRNDLFRRTTEYHRINQGKKFDWKNHPKLREAIEQYFFSKQKDLMCLHRPLDEMEKDGKDQKRMNSIGNSLRKDYGHCSHCARELIRYMNRSFVDRKKK